MMNLVTKILGLFERKASNEIKQYRPAFVDGYENEIVPFHSVNELLKIKWVAKFANRPDFHRFSLADEHLMAEYRGGREWWIVGTIKNRIKLPKWEEVREK